jgi:hypothetical protein
MTATPTPRTAGPNLSKSRFVAGSQCDKLLWLRVHEPDAEELAISPKVQDLFDQGNEVGALARAHFPDGVMVEGDHRDPVRIERTAALIAAGTPVIFEATFVADRTYAAVDVLVREGEGWTLIEVKSGVEPKERYVLDAAVQAYVARRCGLAVRRVEIMHLSRDYVHPGPMPLFERSDVTVLAEQLQDGIAPAIARQLAVLSGPQPDVAIGAHCREPSECVFQGRCWPAERDSVLRFAGGMRFDKRFELFTAGVRSITDVPASFKLNAVQQRQKLAIERGDIVVRPGLGDAVGAWTGRTGFLDFETVGRAVPRWNGTKPWQNVGVQWSYHERGPDGRYTHAEHIAAPEPDPRYKVAEALVEATRGADVVLMYTPFERTQIRMMQEMNPSLAGELAALEGKLQDLKKVVYDHVYHPDFGGSFSLKDVLPALCGETYKDTVDIGDGQEASAKLARLLFYSHLLTDIERAQLKKELLAYCKQDTWAMVQVYEKLLSLAG